MKISVDLRDKVIRFGMYSEYAMRLVNYMFCAAEKNFNGQSLLKEMKSSRLPIRFEHKLVFKYLNDWRGERDTGVWNVFSFYNRWQQPKTACRIHCGVAGMMSDREVCVGLGSEWKSLEEMMKYYESLRDEDLVQETVWFYQEAVKLVCEMFIANNESNKWKAYQLNNFKTDESFNENALRLAHAVLDGDDAPAWIAGEKLDPIKQAAVDQCLLAMSKCKRNEEDQKTWHECRELANRILGVG